MKCANTLALLFTAGALVATTTACDLLGLGDPDDNGPGGGVDFQWPTFLLASDGNDAGLAPGLVKLTVADSAPSFEPVTDLGPTYNALDNVDYRGGRVAFRIDPGREPEGTSGVAFMDADDLGNIRYAPVPEAPIDHWWQIDNARPTVFGDGRIGYRVTLQTDNEYDDAHWGQLAIFDPATDEVEVSGDVSSFVLAQPELGADTEGGSMDGPCFASADDTRAYCRAYGYGTDAGAYHIDYYFVVSYQVGQPGSYERVAQSEDRLTGITGDGRYLLLTGDGLHRIDTGSLVSDKIDDYAHDFHAGMFASGDARFVKAWRGSGLALLDASQNPSFVFNIVLGENLAGDFQGLGKGAQFSPDGQSIYFPASTDFYNNYRAPQQLLKAPVADGVTEPKVLCDLDPAYWNSFFLLLGD